MSTIEYALRGYERENRLMMTRRQLFGRSALGLGPPLKFAVFCGARLPSGGPYAELFAKLRDTPTTAPLTLHCISSVATEAERAESEALVECFAPAAETLYHDKGAGAMPPKTWWEESRGFPERANGGNRWVTQFGGPFYY